MSENGNLEKDVGVLTFQNQVLSRDLERLRQEFIDYKEENDKAVRGLQDTLRWLMGGAAALGGILTVGGSAIVKFLAGLIAKG